LIAHLCVVVFASGLDGSDRRVSGVHEANQRSDRRGHESREHAQRHEAEDPHHEIFNPDLGLVLDEVYVCVCVCVCMSVCVYECMCMCI
jgi:hypothetical protein